MPKPFVFVLMPFDSQFDDTYKLGIKETCESLNAYCERLDEQIFEENMLERIYNQIAKADIIIADLTGKNANVFYETGYAHALDKKVILLTKNVDDIPFDLKHHFHIVYNNIVSLKDDLKKRVQWHISHPHIKQLPDDNSLKLYMNGFEIMPNQQIKIIESGLDSLKLHGQTPLSIQIDVTNDSNEVFSSPVKIGVLVKYFHSLNHREEQKETKAIRLNSDEYLYISKELLPLFPQSWESIKYKLVADYNPQIKSNPLPLTIRVFSEFGIRDIPVVLIYEFTGYGKI